MQCTYCFAENRAHGRCSHCGSGTTPQALTRSISSTTRSTPFTGPLSSYPLMRGDTLSNGRYRLMHQIVLPETQQNQGTAWSAMDMKASRHQVIIREIIVPQEMARHASSREALVLEAAQRMQSLGQRGGFPAVAEYFTDKNRYFLVLQHPEGETLTAVLKRQNGALPEPVVAAYGYQLCGLLSMLADQRTPLVHGSICPETIIVNEEKQSVSLIHLPLFPLDASPSSVKKMSSGGYNAPERMQGQADPSSDLYSLAATLYHAVTGYEPHTRVAFFHPPARRLNPVVTPQFEAILVRQLSLSKSQRYQQASEMQKDFAALNESYPDTSSSDPSLENVGNLLHLSKEELQEHNQGSTLLNMGIFAAIGVLLLVGVLFAIIHP